MAPPDRLMGPSMGGRVSNVRIGVSRQVGRWAVAASVVFGVIAGASAAGANPMVMYYRWYDDPTDVDGGHLRYCDWNLVSNTTPPSFDCVPNVLINPDPGDGQDSP